MDNLNDITDDLLTLPGFLRRNLLLIRDLDLKSSTFFNEANKLSQSVFGTEFDTDNRTSSIDKVSTVSGHSSTVSFGSVNKQEYTSSKKEYTTSSGRSEGSQKKEDTPENKSKMTKLKHDTDRSDKSDKNTNTKLVSSKRRITRDSMSSDNDSENLFFEHTKQFDEIQNLRMQGIYVLQEKIDVNTQITSMLKYEYENLKSKFDSLYSEMDLKGQIPHELKMYIASNKKRLHTLGTFEDEEGQAKKSEDRSIANNQLDIATMFRNVINSQKNFGKEDGESARGKEGEGKEPPMEHGSKVLKMQPPENQAL